MLFVEAEEARVIQITAAQFMNELLPLRAAIVQGWRFKAERLRQLADQAHVFERQRRPPARSKTTPHHAVAVEIQDATLGEVMIIPLVALIVILGLVVLGALMANRID